jgi:hypothetical protein
MDARITKKRLNILLSYDWIKIIALIVAAIMAWSLIFTMTGTRVTQAQDFTIFNYTGTVANSGFSNYADLLGNDEVFSYDILDVTTTDITTSSTYAQTILQTRITTNEGDALFAANIEDADNTDAYAKPDGTAYTPTYLQEFLYDYYTCIDDFGTNGEIGGYLRDMKAYLNDYYHGDYETGELDESLVKADFRARIKKLNDKRFKKESKILEGEQQEIARIANYRKNLIEFEGYLDNGYIALQETTLYFEEGTYTGYYSINLCPDESTMGSLKKDVYYTTTETTESGVNKQVSTAKDINIVLLDIADADYRYTRWEGLSFVNYVVRSHLTLPTE